MSNFALDTGSSAGDIISGLNYALANLGNQTGAASTTANVLTANIQTGNISTTYSNTAGYISTTIVSYLYQYMDVAFANSATGSAGFTTTSPRLANYYGLHNTTSNVVSTNPVEYSWYRVVGGFGTTKNLYYQTLGGRQLNLFIGNTAPDLTYVQTQSNTPINLDSISSAQNNQVIISNAYLLSNVAPATPSGGFYNFATLTLTPPNNPVQWATNLPSITANANVWISQAQFVGNSISNVAPSTTWTTPAVIASGFSGNTGAQGQRGFVPMGYVVTVTDPTSYTNIEYSTAFSSSRSNTSPPIGLGFNPISGDTAQFFWQNTLNPNGDVTVVKQYDGTNWNLVVGSVISGNLFVTQSITAAKLNANDIYAINIQSTGANIGNVSSPGYWLQANTGSASFAGTVTIGNNLTVGNTAVVGANLAIGTNANIGNNLTIGNNAAINNNLSVGINANIGNNLTIGNNAIVGANLAIGINANIGNNLTVGNTAVIGTNANIGNNLTVGNNTNIGNNLTVGNNAAINNNLSVGTNANIGNNLTIGNNAIVGANLAIGINANIGNNLTVGNTAVVGTNANIGNSLTVGNNTNIGNNLTVGNNAVINNNLSIGINANIGNNLTIGNNAVINNNLSIGINANIGNNLTIGNNTNIGNNLTVGNNIVLGNTITVGTNLTVGNNAVIGGNAIIGSNVSVGNNLTVGNNAVIGGNVNISGLVISGSLAPNTVTTTQITDNSITTSKIQANSITGDLIQANTIQGTSIVAGTITGTQLAANTIIVANSIQSANSTFGNTQSKGYWLDAGTGNATFGGNINIGSNLTVAGLITTGNLTANTVTTNNLIVNTVTTIVTAQSNFGLAQVTPVSNSSARFIWPDNTRGVAISGTIVPTTNGAVNGSSIKVNYNVYISTNNAPYNLIELWKGIPGLSYNYSKSFKKARSLWPLVTDGLWPLTSTPLGRDIVYGVGANGSYMTNIPTSGNTYSTGFSGTSSLQAVIGTYSTNSANTVVTSSSTYLGGVATNPVMAIYDSEYLAWSANSVIRPVLSVGSSGSIMRTTDASYLSGIAENSGVITDLFGVAVSQPPLYTRTTQFVNWQSNIICVAVGTNGVILRSVRSYNNAGVLTSGGTWTQIDSGVTTNLRAVSYNLIGAGSVTMQFVAVGDQGVILSSPDGITWTKQNYYTSAGRFANTTNLYDVGYFQDGSGGWFACGENGLILYTDSLTSSSIWSTLTSYTTRNFYTVVGSNNRYTYPTVNDQIIAGDEVIHTPGPNSGLTVWPYYGNPSFTSNGYQRLQFLGSYPDLTTSSLPISSQQVTNNQTISSVYLDTNYTAGVPQVYYLVIGNMNGNASPVTTYTSNPTITLTEQKR
jgi:UDP-3-O-[3-hydroxymyristoyl] glucosamine N-acyltransferase